MSLSKISQFLQVRSSGFYFRRKIPSRIRAVIEQREFVFSLRTSEKNTAIFRAGACLQLTDQLLSSVTADNRHALSLAFKAQLQTILCQTPSLPSKHGLSDHLDWTRTSRMLGLRPQAATQLPEPSLSLLFIIIDLLMAEPKGIDPAFKLHLREHLQSLAHEEMQEFEDQLFIDSNIVEKLELYERGHKLLSSYLANPRTLKASVTPGDNVSDKLIAIWNDVSAYIGDSDPEAAQLYCNREVLKTFLQGFEKALRIAKDPGFIQPTQQASIQHIRETAFEEPSPSPTISAAWEQYASEVGARWSKHTREMYLGYIQEFISPEFAGNMPVSQLTRDDLVSYRNKLQRLPAQRKKDKRYRNRSVQELLEMEIPINERFADRSINERLTLIGSFLRWCRAVKGYTDKDLTYGVLIKNPESAERAPFTPADIACLFSPEHYQPKLIDSPFKFWIPLLGIYSGARLSEIAQLTPEDILHIDDVPTIRVTDEGDEQNVKTAAGKRLIPLHNDLITIGFLDYVRTLRSAGQDRLFPDLPKAERAGTPASKWFTRYRRARGVQDVDALGREKVFHSFRHTVITRLMHGDDTSEQTIPIPLIQQIVGHEKSLIGETATYTHDYPITKCKLAIESLAFGIDTTRLKTCWERVYREHSAKKAKA